MKRILKIGLVAVGSLVALVVAVVALTCWLVVTPARLTGIVNRVADRYLDCEISVGEIDLTLFSTFPDVSLQLSDVVLINPVGSMASDTVASIRQCRAVLDIDALVNDGTVTIRALQLDGGWANLYTTADGKSNYMIFPVDTLEEATDTVAFEMPDVDVEEIDIRNIYVDYRDVSAGQSATIEGLTMRMGGHMAGEQLEVTLSASLHCLAVALEGDSPMGACVENVGLELDGNLQGDDAKAHAKLTVGRMDAQLPDMDAHVEQMQWTLDGNGEEGRWMGSTALVTQPAVVCIGGEAPMRSALSGMQLKAEGEWTGKDIVVSPALLLPGLTVELDGEQMIDNADIRIRVTVRTDTLLNRVLLSDGLLALNEHEVSLKGGMEMPDTSTVNASVSFETNRCDITQLLALVPQSYHYLLDGIDITGGVALKGEGRGSLVGGEARIGEAGATLSLDNINLLYNDSIALNSRSASMNVVYDGRKDEMSGRLASEALRVAMVGMAEAELNGVDGTFTALQTTRIAEGRVDAEARISAKELVAEMDTMGLYTRNAVIDVALDADKNMGPRCGASLCLDSMHTVMGTLLTASTGSLRVKGQATYNEAGDNVLAQWSPQLAVEVMAGDVASSMLSLPMEIPHIQFDYADGHFTINDSRILLGNSDFGLRGDVHNIDSFISKTGLLKAELDFGSDYTDVTQLMGLVSGLGASEETQEAEAEDETANAEDDPFMVPLGVDVKLNTDIRTVNVNGFDFDDIGGHLLVKDGVLVLEEMGFTSDAARMQLTGMYKSPRKNHLFVGFDFHLLDIEIDELIHMIPDVDSIVPMLKAFDGEAEFHFAGETYLKSNYDIKMSTLRAAGAIEGKDLVVMDNETFAQISKYLLFDKDTKNVVDSISVEMTVFKDEVDLYPFLVSMDDYKAVIGGRHNINEDFDFNYHISLTSPLRLGLDIGGTLDDMKFRLVGCKYAQMYNPQKQNAVQARTLQLKKIISDSLKDNVKPQPEK